MGLGDTVMPEREDGRVTEETKGVVLSDTPLMAEVMEKSADGSTAVIMGIDAGRASL